MKKLLILITCHLLLVTFPAMAKVCVGLTDTAPNSGMYSEISKTWQVGIGCADNTGCKRLIASGEALCSYTAGTYGVKGAPRTDYANNSDTVFHYNWGADDENCWCRMTHPFAGAWVSLGLQHAGAFECALGCAFACRSRIIGFSDIRAAVLSKPN